MFNDPSWINWEGKVRNAALFYFQCQSRMRGQLRFRQEICKDRLKNMQLSTQHEIISSHTRPVHSIALEKQDSQFLLCGGLDGFISLFDLNGRDENQKNPDRRSLKHISMASNSAIGRAAVSSAGPAVSMAVSSVNWYPQDSGLFAASDFDGNLNIWDTNTFSIVANFKLVKKIFNSKFNADGSLIAVALDDRSIRLCDPSCGDCTHVLSGHTAGVTCVEWSPSEEYLLASASWDGKIKLWDVRKGSYGAVLMSFDWQQDHTARVESSRDDDSHTFMKEGSSSSSSSFSSFSSSSSSNFSYTDRGGVSSFTSMQRAEHFNSDRNRMKKFEWKKDDVAKAHEASGVNSILFTACGRFLVSSGNDRRVRLWSTNNGYLHSINYDVSCTSSLPFAMELISDFSSGADDVLAHPSGDQGDIALVALHSSSGKPFKHLKGHLGAVTCIAYRQGHGQLITAAKDGMVYLWDCSASQKERELRVDDDRLSKKGRRDAGAVAIHNDDSWSDGGGVSEEEQRAPPRYFVPPIVQRYLEDAAESKRQHQQEQQRVAAARATARIPSTHRSGVRVQPSGQGEGRGGEGGDGVRGVGGMYDSTSITLHSAASSSEQYGSSSKYQDTQSSSSSGQGRAQAPARTGMEVKYKAKGKDSYKDKSVRERAEILFALNAASALRNTATSSSSSTSSSTTSSAVASESHILGSNISDISCNAQQRNGSASAMNGSHDKAAISLCQREKEKEDKENEKKVGKGKKEKSKLTSLREKFSATSKKPRR